MTEGACARRSVVHFTGLYGFVSSLNLFSQFLKSGKVLASIKPRKEILQPKHVVCNARPPVVCLESVTFWFDFLALDSWVERDS